MLRHAKLTNKKTHNENHKSTGIEDFSVTEIFINAQKKEWVYDTISYEQLVILSGQPYGHENTAYTIQYSRGPAHCIQGTLIEGQSADIQDGIAFDVTITDNA